MIDVNSLKTYIQNIANIEQSGNKVTPDMYNDWLDKGIIDAINRRIGIPEQYQVGMPLPKQAYEISSKITNDLLEIKKIVNITVDAEGKAPLPTDFLYHSATRFRYVLNQNCGNPIISEKKVEIVDDTQLPFLLNNSIKAPTKKYPIATFQNPYLQCYPSDLKEIKFTYLCYPKKPFWGYTIDKDDNVIYDPTKSVHIELPYSMVTMLAGIILGYLGINLREAELENYSQKIKVQGE